MAAAIAARPGGLRETAVTVTEIDLHRWGGQHHDVIDCVGVDIADTDSRALARYGKDERTAGGDGCINLPKEAGVVTPDARTGLDVSPEAGRSRLGATGHGA